MKLFLLLSVQAAAAPAPAPAAPTRVDPIDFDLARLKPAGPAADCDRSQGSDIVVCGRRRGYVYPLEAMARIYEAKPLRAQTGIGGSAVADVHVEDATMPNGMVSHRLMFGIKLPF